MKDWMRKVALLMALCLTVSSLSFAELSAGRILYDLGLIDGTGDGLNEEAAIDRASLAKLLTDFYGVSYQAEHYPKNIASSLFDDIDENHWAASYIGYVYAQGWMIGGSEKEFMPGSKVSSEMVYTVFLRVLGYSPVWGQAGKEAEQKGINTFIRNRLELLRKEVFEIGVKVLDTEVNGDDRLLGKKLGLKGYEKTKNLQVLSVKPVKRNVIEVIFDQDVEKDDVLFKLTDTKDNYIYLSEPMWSNDKRSARLNSSSDLTYKDYIMTITALSEDKEITTVFKVESSHADKIVIKNQLAFVNSSNQAHVYYDVLDQYGEPQNGLYEVQWVCPHNVQVDYEKGLVKVTRSSGTFTYGEEFPLTGYYVYKNLSVTETITVAETQYSDQVEIKGFMKQGSNVLLERLPVNYDLTGTYYVLFKIYDQLGNEMLVDKPITNVKVAILSNNSSAVKEVSGAGEMTVTILNEDYYAGVITPGTDTGDLVEYTLTGYATGSGKSTEFYTRLQ